jgi:hypothetical protein
MNWMLKGTLTAVEVAACLELSEQRARHTVAAHRELGVILPIQNNRKSKPCAF